MNHQLKSAEGQADYETCCHCVGKLFLYNQNHNDYEKLMFYRANFVKTIDKKRYSEMSNGRFSSTASLRNERAQYNKFYTSVFITK